MKRTIVQGVRDIVWHSSKFEEILRDGRLELSKKQIPGKKNKGQRGGYAGTLQFEYNILLIKERPGNFHLSNPYDRYFHSWFPDFPTQWLF